MENYRLVKELAIFYNDKIIRFKPQVAISGESDMHQLVGHDGNNYNATLKLLDFNPEYFEKCIDWSKEKYFRNGCEAIGMVGKIYPITQILGEAVFYLNDNKRLDSFEVGSKVDKMATPATEAEYLAQQGVGKKEKLIEKYYKIVDEEDTSYNSNNGIEICDMKFIIKQHVKLLLKAAIEEALK
jgi:hypothetical protein